MEGTQKMKGFVISTVIAILVIGFVISSTLMMNHKIGDVSRAVEETDLGTAAKRFEAIRPFLHLCTPDDLLRDVELALLDARSGGEEEESRLLLLLQELRRQAGFHPISVL